MIADYTVHEKNLCRIHVFDKCPYFFVDKKGKTSMWHSERMMRKFRSANDQSRKDWFQTALILDNSHSNQDYEDKVSGLRDDLISAVSKKQKEVTNIESEPYFVNFQSTSDTEYKNENEFSLSAVKTHRDYKFSDTTWTSINCAEFRFGPFLLKTMCHSPKGQPLEPENPSVYKVFVALENAKPLRNLWDYAVYLKDGKITNENHLQLFLLLKRVKDRLHLILDNDKELRIGNVNYDVPVLHFNFICGPVNDHDKYRCFYDVPVMNYEMPRTYELFVHLTSTDPKISKPTSEVSEDGCMYFDIEKDLQWFLQTDAAEFVNKHRVHSHIVYGILLWATLSLRPAHITLQALTTRIDMTFAKIETIKKPLDWFTIDMPGNAISSSFGWMDAWLEFSEDHWSKGMDKLWIKYLLKCQKQWSTSKEPCQWTNFLAPVRQKTIDTNQWYLHTFVSRPSETWLLDR